jgi:hypothetical protein
MQLIDKLLPKKPKEEAEPTPELIEAPKLENSNLVELIDRDSLHALFPFSWEQYPTYVQSGENFMRVIAIADYPKRVYGNWLSELKRKKARSI